MLQSTLPFLAFQTCSALIDKHKKTRVSGAAALSHAHPGKQ
jgi:hypothetical protein